MEIKQEFPDKNLIEVKSELISHSDGEIEKIEAFHCLIPQKYSCQKLECNIENEITDMEMEIKRECSPINLIEVKPEPLLLSDVEIQKVEETFNHFFSQENSSCQKWKCTIKNEILDVTNDTEIKQECSSINLDYCVKKQLKLTEECKQPICQKYISSKLRLEQYKQCGERLTQKIVLNRHLRTHTGEKQFKCEICLKHFTHKRSFKDHLKIHTDSCWFKPSEKKTSNKYCVVPECRSTSRHTPEKLFISVPFDPATRKVWQKAMRRDVFVSDKSHVHCCEDHFNIKDDIENYMYIQTMKRGNIRLKPKVVPRFFDCQKNGVGPTD